MMSSLRFLVTDSWRLFGFRVPLLVFLMILSGLFEGLAVTLALPLLGAFGAPSAGSVGTFVTFLAQMPHRLGLPEGALGVGVMMLGLILISAATFILQARYATVLRVNYAAHWQQDLFETILRADLGFWQDRRAGDVVNALVTDVTRVNGAFYHSCLVLAALVNFVIYFLLAVLVSPLVSAAVVVLGGALLLATRPFIRRAYGYGGEITRASADVQSLAGEYISAAKQVKAHAAERISVDRFAEASYRLAMYYFKDAFDVQKAKAIFEFGGAAGVAVLLIAGPLFFSVDIATVIVVLALFVRLLPRVTALQQGVQALSSLLPALTNLRNLRDQAKLLREPLDERPLPADIAMPVPGILMSGVKVVRGDRVVLHDVDLDIPSGKILAIVGPSGSGKSTLVDALLRLVPVAEGQILIGSHELNDLPLSAWRRSIGYVSQDTALLTGSIADNVRFGNGASPEKIGEALGLAAADFADQRGIEVSVGERGALLSGGERQRLGLARALAVPRLLYVLDEATSALDAETEARVIETVSALAGKATVLIVAHRFSAVRCADIIHVVEGGRVVESGSWDDLDRPGSRFHALKELQQVTSAAVAK